MSTAYFDNDYVSNSDLKRLRYKVEGRDELPNLQEIFDLGTLIHQVLLEPHLADRTHPEYELAFKMAETVLRDSLCRQFIMMSDMRREHEWYKRDNPYNLNGQRCKTDGDTRLGDCIFEYKGLGVTTQKAFDEATMRFDYDQSSAWYLDITGLKRYLIVGVSKKNPKLLFKKLIDRDHHYYKRGLIKVQSDVNLWHTYIGDTKSVMI